MTANKHTPFLTNEQVQALNEKHGWFKHGDAQSDVSRAFANDAVAAYERVRSAAPELLEALVLSETTMTAALHACGYEQGSSTDGWTPAVQAQVAALVSERAAIAKATGASA